MTDPLSATASAAGVISLGLSVSSGLLSYYESYKSSGSTVTAMYTQLEALASTLSLLNKVLDRGYAQLDPVIARQVEESVESCREGIEKLEKKLGKIRILTQHDIAGGMRQQLGKQVHKAVFPFKESTLVKLRELVMDLRNDLGLVLGVLQIDASAVSLQRLHGIDGKLELLVHDATATSANVLKFGQDIEAISDVLAESQLDEERRRIHEWLRPPDPFANQDAAREKHEESTNEWLLRSLEFTEWRDTPNGLLMVYGIPGSGKTVIASSIIAEIENTMLDSKCVLLYYYFDFNDRRKQTVFGCVSSLFLQLAMVTDDFHPIWLLYRLCDQGQRQPTAKELQEALRGALAGFPKTFVVLDALDECQELDAILDLIVAISVSWKLDVRLLATSRRERRIDEILESVRLVTINLQDNLITRDIQVYVQKRLSTNPRLKKWCFDAQTKEEIERTLIDGADGMFRWVVCQLDALQRCLTIASLKKTLRTLPKTLFDTYDRILLNIDSTYHELAVQVLQWLVVSQRPLYIEEAAESVTLLPVNENGRPGFDADNRLSDPNDIFQICLSLVNTTTATDSRVRMGQLVSANYMRLAHNSVQEFLTSETIRHGPNSGFFINEADAHASVAQACIAYLLSIEGRISSDISVNLPLADYAANYWNVHAEIGSSSENAALLVPMVIEMLGSMETMSNVHTLCKPHYPRRLRTDKPALHWAVQYGLSNVAAEMTKKVANINERDAFGRTALHVAIKFRRESIARSLLKNGIDVNAKDCSGTALYYAIHTRDVTAVRFLLDAHADPNVHNHGKSTPLYSAAERNNSEIARLLLDHGADPNMPCTSNVGWEGGIPGRPNDASGEFPRVRSIVGTPSQVAAWSGAPLQVAAWSGYTGMVATLLEAGAVVKDRELLLLSQGKVQEAIDAVGNTGAFPSHLQAELPDYGGIVKLLQDRLGGKSLL